MGELLAMRRVMLIGAVGSGKSSLTEALLGSHQTASKTQALSFRDWVVDTPGEYTENPLFYKALMATALEITDIILVQDATRSKAVFPPGFMAGIPKRLIGAVTKSDSAEADVQRAVSLLRQSMPLGDIVVTSAKTGAGIPELLQLLGHGLPSNTMQNT
jgi:ethanolamine utilization protein EutP